MRTPLILSSWLAALMAVQSLLGLVLQGQYRDVAWIRATWFGNDLVTLLLVVPLLLVAIALVRRGSMRGLLLWFGVLGYGAYNYAYYLLGAALNAFFALYDVLLVASVVTLILALTRVDAAEVAAAFGAKMPFRAVGGFLVFVAAGLAIVWFGMWAAHIFAGRPTPVTPEAFKLVAALDTAIMVPAMAFGGVLLWRRSAWGGIAAGIASIMGALYLFVLSVNSVIAVVRGLVPAPGELPIWGVLGLSTAAAAAAILANAQRE
jgi:hypothetical protein